MLLPTKWLLLKSVSQGQEKAARRDLERRQEMELDSGLCIYTAEKHGVKTEKTKIMKKPSKIKKLIYVRMYLLYILNIILVYDAKGSNQKSCHSSCRH